MVVELPASFSLFLSLFVSHKLSPSRYRSPSPSLRATHCLRLEFGREKPLGELSFAPDFSLCLRFAQLWLVGLVSCACRQSSPPAMADHRAWPCFGRQFCLKSPLWQNHLNYMAHMCLPLSYRLLIAAHASQITPVVCRVSSGKPESSMFYNSYMINKGVVTTLQHLI
jgi:hypothetical protein